MHQLLNQLPAYSMLLAFSCSVAAEAAEQKEVERIQVLGYKQASLINYTSFDREEFLGQKTNLADFLNEAVGLQVRSAGAAGSPTSVSIRGSTHQQVQFYVDGQLVNDSQFGGFDVNSLPLEIIEKIEISKSQAIGTGSTPIGGVIKITTFNPEQDQTRISTKVGSFDHYEAHVLTSIGSKNNRITISGDYIKAKNDYTFTVAAPIEHTQKSEDQPLKNNHYLKKSFYISQAISMAEQEIKLGYLHNNQKKELPTYRINSPYNDSFMETVTNRYSLDYRWGIELDTLKAVHLDSYFEDKNEHYFEKPTEKRAKYHDYETDTSAVNLEVQLVGLGVSWLPYVQYLNSRYESVSDASRQGQVCNGIIPCDVFATQNVINLGGRMEWQPGESPWSAHLLLNKRWERSSNRVNQPYFETTTTQLNQSSHHLNTTYEAAANYLYSALDFQISLLGSKGLRAPALYELYGDRGLMKGNAELLPETSQSLTLALEQKRADFRWRVNLYRKQLDDAIARTFNGDGVGKYINVSNAKLTGAELSGEYSITNNFDLSAAAHFIDSQSRSNYSTLNNKFLPGIYHQQFQLKMNYRIDSYWLWSLSAAYDSNLYYNASNKNDKTGDPVRHVIDAAFQYNRHGFQASLAINNLTDHHYRDLNYRPSVGRNIYLTITIRNI